MAPMPRQEAREWGLSTISTAKRGIWSVEDVMRTCQKVAALQLQSTFEKPNSFGLIVVRI